MPEMLLKLWIVPLLLIAGVIVPASDAHADTPFIGEVRLFAGNFAPRNYVFCDGQLLPIAQYSALFSILGTTYGGDGRTNFGVPDLRGRTPIGPGNGPGLTSRRYGEQLGQETVTLTPAQIALHNHPLIATTDAATSMMPDNNLPANPPGLLGTRIYADGPPNTMMSTTAIDDPSTSTQAHNNMQPFLGLNYIIAIQGVFPSRN